MANKFLSREEYLDKQRQAIIEQSIKNSNNRILPTVPLILELNEKEWKEAINNSIETVKSKLNYAIQHNHRKDIVDGYQNKLNRLNDELNKGYVEELRVGNSCLYTSTDNYGKKYRISGNQSFRANPAKYGFKEINLNDIKAGDIIQALAISDKRPNHAMTFVGYDNDGKALFNYSKGGQYKEDIVKNGHYPFSIDYDKPDIHLNRSNADELRHAAAAYRFIGTEDDNKAWEEQYYKDRSNFHKQIAEELKQVPTLTLPNQVQMMKFGGMKENKVFKLKGGVAIPLDDKKKLFYLSGAKHEQGGIDVTPELEAEGGEVVKVNPKSIKVVTAQKIMGGKSPAELVVDASSTGKSDAVFNKVFNYQEEFKDRVGLNDDGTRKAKFGKFINGIKNKVKAFMGSDYKFNKIYNNGDEVYKELNNIVSSATSDKDLETKLNNFWDSIKDNASIGYDTFKGIKQDIEHYKKYPYSSIVLTRDRVDYDKKEEFNRKHSIPVDQNKIVTLRNAGKSNNTTLSTNLLDSLAYRAGRAKADTVRMLGVPAQETGLGKFEGTTYMSPASIRINDINYPLYRGEYAEKFMRDGEITPSELMNNHNYYTNTADQEAIGAISRKHNVGHDASKGYIDAVIDYNEINDDVEKSFKETFNYTTNKRKKENINIHPLEDAYRLDKLGIYNTGLPNHNELVEARGRELWKSPEIKQWWNTSGKSFYEKGKSETKRLGGNMKKKAVLGLKDVNLENKEKYTDSYLKNKELFENRVIQQNPNTTLAPIKKSGATSNNFDITGNNFDNKLTGYDWANIGVNALGSLLTFGHALGNAKVNPLKYSDPVPYTGAKLKTRVNINSAKQKIKRATDKINDSINKNTSNSTVALNRLRNTYLNERDALVDLYTNKENTENQLINKDILNQQSARFKTISDYNTVRRENEKNRYLAERETQENVNNAISGFVQNIGNATSSIANTLEQRDQFNKNMKILGLAYPNLDVDRLNKVIRPTNVEKAERARKREKVRLIRKGIIKPSEI